MLEGEPSRQPATPTRNRDRDWKSCVVAVDASRIWTLAEPADDIVFEAGVAVAPGTRTPAPRMERPRHT
jgi:hypothetical protein